MSTCSLAGHTVINGTIHLPSWGIWIADVELDTEVVLSGKVQLLLQDLTLQGAIVSGGPWQGRSTYRVFGGAGGWCKEVPSKGYTNDAGVKYSTAISDAATLVGEPISGPPAGTFGIAFERMRGPASRVLNLLCPQAWYVDLDGVTRFGVRTPFALTTKCTIGDVDFAAGSAVVMADSLVKLVPGVIVQGIQAVDVVHTIAPGKLRTTVYGSAFGNATKRLAAWSRLFEQLRPFEAYKGLWEYRVIFQLGDRLDLQPASTRFGLPSLRAVRCRYGVPGMKASIPLGSMVLVAFINGEPTKPMVVGFNEPGTYGFEADELSICAGATGTAPWEHATSAEALTVFLASILKSFSLIPGGSLTGASVAAASDTIVNAALALMSSAPVTLYEVSLNAALSAKTADPTRPNIGWPKVRGA